MIFRFFHRAVAEVISQGLVKESAARLRQIDDAAEPGASKPIQGRAAIGSTPTSHALEMLPRRSSGGRQGRLKNIEKARANENIFRTDEFSGTAGLMQFKLAKVMATMASVICRLEDAGSEWHSVNARRIGANLNQRDDICFVPILNPA